MRTFLTEVTFPVEQDGGSALLDFERMSEDDIAHLDPAIPLPASLVVLWWDDRCLLVFNRFRQAWELPGGMLDPGESPRAAALRELDEESRQQPDTLEFAGVARCRVAPDERIQFLAIYRGHTKSPQPFRPNDEMTGMTWWQPSESMPNLLPIDAALARLCL